MKNWNSILTLTTTIAACAGIAIGGDDNCTHGACEMPAPDSIASPNEITLRQLAGKMIHSLSPAEQRAIAERHGLGSDALDIAHFSYEVDRSAAADLHIDITARQYKEIIISDKLWERMTPNQRGMIDAIIETIESGTQPAAMCFAPGMDPEIAYAINQMIEFPIMVLFQEYPRWSSTATDGDGLVQGQPTTLTYSYVPDGSFVPDLGIGLGSGLSSLHQWLNGIYGTEEVWMELFDQVFDRWAELTGTSYVYEPNDDGALLNTPPGVLGVRGDIRIAAFNYPTDGDFGVLAYNNFPQDGDMVFDSFDAFYENTDANSLRFRNVTAHEHGHGLGMLHVCPIQQSKLMEPFVTVAFDGPQLDDILNGHRNYGDPMEPSDNTGEATELGSVDVGAELDVENVSLDDNSDVDYFSINLINPAHIFVRAAPDAGEYLQGPQTQFCNSGSSTNYITVHDLRVALYEPGNTDTPVLLANVNGRGNPELLDFNAADAGEYFIRIDTLTSTDSVQRYSLEVVISDLPFLGPIISAESPETIEPGVENEFSVTIDPGEDSLVKGTAMLLSSVNGGSFSSVAMSSEGGNQYTASLPVVGCEDTIEFYISVEGVNEGVVTLPAEGASAPMSTLIGSFTTSFSDDFEVDMNWSVSGSVPNQANGQWERGIPAGDGSRGDAPVDADGSGSCYLTGNGAGGSDTDVDDGNTILTSSSMDLSGNPEADISYYRWFHNSAGGVPNVETFLVELSDDGGDSWVELETVAGNSPESNGGWFHKSFRIADFVTTSSEVRIRFIAKDDVAAVVEAAVDGVKISGFTCENPPDDCLADLTGEGELDFLDISAFLGGYNNQDLISDLNGDGEFDFLDISVFLGSYSEGCP